jgi:type 1 glutamine amidotransferase
MKRVWLRSLPIFTILLSVFLSPSALDAAAQRHVVFVLGDHEYSGELTMPLFAKALEQAGKIRTTVLRSSPDQNGETDIPGLQALQSADLAIFFLRWRRLPAEQLAYIDAYVKSGKPVIGLRTTSHSFNYPKGDPLEAWNRWGEPTFGTPPGWRAEGHTHFGHQSTTEVSVNTRQAKHPILNGIRGTFPAQSWLYRVRPKYPPSDAVVLLNGRAINPDKPAEENPVAWTWRNTSGGRVFFTTLGHPEDFKREEVQRLLYNAIYWALGAKPPRWSGPLPINVPYRGIVSTK